MYWATSRIDPLYARLDRRHRSADTMPPIGDVLPKTLASLVGRRVRKVPSE